MGITFMMVTNRLAIVTGMPTIHAIRKYYGSVAAGFVGIALFMACLFFTMGNISGTGAGVNLITGLNWKVGSALMIAVVIYCYFTKNVYSKVEKIITACILGMIVAFYATLIGVGGPDWGETGKGICQFSDSGRRTGDSIGIHFYKRSSNNRNLQYISGKREKVEKRRFV